MYSFRAAKVRDVHSLRTAGASTAGIASAEILWIARVTAASSETRTILAKAREADLEKQK